MAFKIGGEFSLKGNAKKFLGDVGNALGMLQKRGNAVGATLKKTESVIQDTERGLLRQTQAAKKAGLSVEQYKTSLTTARAAALKAGVATDKLGDSYLNAAGKLVDVRGKFIQTSEAAKKAAERGERAGSLMARGASVASRAWERAGGVFRSVFNVPNTVMAGLTTGVAGIAGKSVLDAVGYKEQQMIAFNTMLKDSGKALSTYKWALKTASDTPFETTDVLDATKRLLASRFTLREIPTMFTTIGDTASGLSLGADGMNSLIRTFGQIRGAGRLTTEDLNQLTDAGVSVIPALERAYGVKGIAFRKLLEQGKVGGEDALGIIVADLQKQFGGGMAKQSKSIFGLASTLKSRPFELFQSLDADKELRPVKNVLENLAAITDFDKNPVGRKIRSRFVSSMNTLFGGVFGNLAKTTDPEAIGKTLDKVFDKFDSAMAWFKTNGPGILADAKAFFGGIGDTIGAVRRALEWAGSALGKLGIGGGSGAVLGAAGAVGAGLMGAKALDGLLGGLPSKVLGGGLGVQKVFVVNMGGLGGGLPDVGGGKGGLLQRAKEGFGKLIGGAKDLAGQAVTKLGGAKTAAVTMLGRVTSGFIGLAGKIGGSLAGLAGSIITKLGAAGAAFGVGWGIGSAINKIPTGKGRTVGGDIQGFFYDNLFGGRELDAKLKQSNLEAARLKALAQKNGRAYGQGLQAGANGTNRALSNAGKGLGNAVNTGVKNELQIKSPSRVAMSIAKNYGQTMAAGLRQQTTPVARAAAVLAASVAVATAPVLPTAKPADQLSASNLPPITAPVRAGSNLPPITITFGDIVVQGGAAPQAVGAAIAENIEMQILEALERMAAKIGGAS